MASQPDLILQLAHHVARRDFEARACGAVEVRVESLVSLNGRRGALPRSIPTSISRRCATASPPRILGRSPARREPPPIPRPVADRRSLIRRARTRSPLIAAARLGSCVRARAAATEPRERSAEPGPDRRPCPARPVPEPRSRPAPPRPLPRRRRSPAAARRARRGDRRRHRRSRTPRAPRRCSSKEQLERFEYDDPTRVAPAGAGRLRRAAKTASACARTSASAASTRIAARRSR